MVTDRSLRIREGVWQMREMTMTFANIQNLSVSQGPVQRFFGISDLQVQTAGGGGAAASGQAGQHQSMHLGFFRGIEDADSVRDLMLERLRRAKDSGLGDRQPAGARAPARKAVTSLGGRALDALRAVRAEATAMRQAAERLE